MKKLNYAIFFILFNCFYAVVCQENNGLTKLKKMETNLKEYLNNPQGFISTHNNKENFVTIFSNFTRLNGEILFNEYYNKKYNGDIQIMLDNLNNIKQKNLNDWDFDIIKRKFALPDDSKFYFFKFLFSEGIF